MKKMRDSLKNSLPTIVRLTQREHSGMMLHKQTRDAIGYVLSGEKCIYGGDKREIAESGKLFYLPRGNRYIENIPIGNKGYEEIVFYYTSDEMSETISSLNIHGFVDIGGKHECEKCEKSNQLIEDSWQNIRIFFESIKKYFEAEFFLGIPQAEKLKLTELTLIILSNSDCCIKPKLLESADKSSESFERIIHNNIFENNTIEEMAEKCDMSLTSFKKEFRRRFHDSPHRWFTRQRLMQGRLLLISTNEKVESVANQCSFSNTSHFIKLFKKEYGHTPASYRRRHRARREKEAVKIAEQEVQFK